MEVRRLWDGQRRRVELLSTRTEKEKEKKTLNEKTAENDQCAVNMNNSKKRRNRLKTCLEKGHKRGGERCKEREKHNYSPGPPNRTLGDVWQRFFLFCKDRIFAPRWSSRRWWRSLWGLTNNSWHWR